MISDVTFTPVSSQVRQSGILVTETYADSIPGMLKQSPSVVDSQTCVLIHSDSAFHRYTENEVSAFLEAVHQFTAGRGGPVILTNSLSVWCSNVCQGENLGNELQFVFRHREAIGKLNGLENLVWLDFQGMISQIGRDGAYNYNLGVLYQMPYTQQTIRAFAARVKAILNFLHSAEKKVIVVDCDNTLWHGTIGEDGVDKVACDKTTNGILHLHFQRFLVQKKAEGFLLALCSRNDESLVREKFSTSRMPLAWKDFTAARVNWQSKPENLLSMAGELGLGLDSFIFIDDSEFELEGVNRLAPQVYTLRFVHDFPHLLNLMEDLSFRRKAILAEDVIKSTLYQQEVERQEVKVIAGSFEDYVESLGIQLDLRVNRKEHYARLAQLTEKTNQFNFGGKRFSRKALQAFSDAGNIVYSLRVQDKFGDYGVVGGCFVKVRDEEAAMVNFILSCRALGRNIESDFYGGVVQDLQERGLHLSEVRFLPTSRNTPAREFYEKHCLTEKLDVEQPARNF